MTTKASKNGRILYLDLIRSVACVMIIIMHSPMEGTGSYLQNVSGLFTAPGVGLFFMVSGALLLPVKEEGWQSVRHRLGKVLWPTLFWTLFYIAANVMTGRCSLDSIPKQLISIPFSTQGHGVLWFMYTLCGLYLLAPVISPWLRMASKRDVEILLGLWGMTLLFPILRLFLLVNDTNTGTFFYFSGFAGYFVLGYYLRRFSPKLDRWALLLLMLIPVGASVGCKLGRLEVNFYDLFWYLSIFVVMMAVAWFHVLRAMALHLNGDSRFVRLLTLFSNCSFGIYLMHIFVLRYCLWGFMPGGGVQILTSVAITIVVCFAITYIVSFLPFASYIIGYQKKKS